MNHLILILHKFYCTIYVVWIHIAGLDWFEVQKYNGWSREDKTNGMLLTCNFAASVHLAAIWCFNTTYLLLEAQINIEFNFYY